MHKTGWDWPIKLKVFWLKDSSTTMNWKRSTRKIEVHILTKFVLHILQPHNVSSVDREIWTCISCDTNFEINFERFDISFSFWLQIYIVFRLYPLF